MDPTQSAGGGPSLNPQTAGPTPSPGQGPNFVQQLQQAHDQSKAQMSSLQKKVSQMKAIRGEFDRLMSLGDTISPEDVIEAAGSLVGAGFGPDEIASMLSQAPLQGGGQALAQWVAQDEAQVKQSEQQLQAAMKQQTIHLGIAGMTNLHANHVKMMQVMGPQNG